MGHAINICYNKKNQQMINTTLDLGPDVNIMNKDEKQH